MYSEEQILLALETYDKVNSITKVIHILRYPTRQTLYSWISRRDKSPKVRSTFVGENTPNHPRNPPLEVKLDALHRCFELGEDVKLVSEDIGYSRCSIYLWRKKYIQKGAVALMNTKSKMRGRLEQGKSVISSKEVENLKSQMQEMQMEIDILKETIDVLKKDPGIDQTSLQNREKAVIVDALKHLYSLPLLLSKLNFSKSSYYYQKNILNSPDKYDSLRHRVKNLFLENHSRYGYQRIHALLIKERCIVSEKIVRRIMKESNLVVFTRKTKKYNSYKGEITPDIVKRNFHADKPNQKWLTDITEFALPTGKFYSYNHIWSSQDVHQVLLQASPV